MKRAVALGVSTDWLLQATMVSIEKDTIVIQFAQVINKLESKQKMMIMDEYIQCSPHFKQYADK